MLVCPCLQREYSKTMYIQLINVMFVSGFTSSGTSVFLSISVSAGPGLVPATNQVCDRCLLNEGVNL